MCVRMCLSHLSVWVCERMRVAISRVVCVPVNVCWSHLGRELKYHITDDYIVKQTTYLTFFDMFIFFTSKKVFIISLHFSRFFSMFFPCVYFDFFNQSRFAYAYSSFNEVNNIFSSHFL